MKVRVSEHAIDKYISLIKEKYGIKIKSRQQCELSILEMFEQAQKEEPHGGLVKRIIDNGFEDSDYYRYDNWRIVVSSGSIVTVEEAFLKRRVGLDAQTNYKCKRFKRYQSKLRKNRDNYERKRIKQEKAACKCDN